MLYSDWLLPKKKAELEVTNAIEPEPYDDFLQGHRRLYELPIRDEQQANLRIEFSKILMTTVR